MKAIVKYVFLMIIFVFSPRDISGAQETMLEKINLEVSSSLDFYSQYIWRGFVLDRDPVIQPGFTLKGYGFTFSCWSSWDVDNSDSLDSDEIDYTIDYTQELGNINFSLGHTYYDFEGTNTYSKEFYLGVGFPKIILSPRLTYYHDYGEEDKGGGRGDYLVLEFSHSFLLEKEIGISFDLSAHVGYNHELFIQGDGGDFLIQAGFTIPLRKNLTFSPAVNYTIPFAALRDSSDGNQKNRFYGGFSLAYSF